jgi:threonine aldolase
MNFCSDNVGGIHPRILEALVAGNAGDAMPYGADLPTRRAEQRLRAVFGRDDMAIAMVATGTACNALALASWLRRSRPFSAAPVPISRIRRPAHR